jgi:hypothetical protein
VDTIENKYLTSRCIDPVDTHEGIHCVDTSAGGLLVLEGIHWVDTSAGGLLVLEGIHCFDTSAGGVLVL